MTNLPFIQFFVRHPTAANLLMIIMIVAGLISLRQTNTQFFPDFGIDWVSVKVEWPGASAEDIDNNIIQSIEAEVRFLDEVKRVRSTSVQGLANVVVEFLPGTDMQTALANVETAIGQVDTLPEDSENPIIQRIFRYDTISKIIVSGSSPELSLKLIAKRIRDELLDIGVDKVEITGARDEEIWVETSPELLHQLNLSISKISSKIRGTSQDFPSGDLDANLKKSVRSLGLQKTAQGLGGIEVLSLSDGQKFSLRQIAKVTNQFAKNQAVLERKNLKAIELHVQRSTSADALKVATKVASYLDKLQPTLPPNINVETFDVQSDLIRSRITLLLENGLTGLVLVMIILFIFLSAPVAFWVAVGIPVAILATLAVMMASGQTINMVSLFGIIMALGIVVDDAIVVGEHADQQYRNGLSPDDAANKGAIDMAAPVLASSLTTIAAFTPLFIISDIIGDIIRGIPLVVVAMIIARLFECFLVLPGHLRAALTINAREVSRYRTRFNDAFNRFRDGLFTKWIRTAIKWRYTTLATAVATLLICVGVIVGGRINFTFFPAPEADKVFAAVQMAAGTSRDQTFKMVHEMERAMYAAEKDLTEGRNGLLKFELLKVGMSVAREDSYVSKSNTLGGIVVELVPSDTRDIRTSDFIAAWRDRIRPIPGTDIFTIKAAQGGPPGRDIDIRLTGKDLRELKRAAIDLKNLLSRYPGISDIDDNLKFGQKEAIIKITPRGQALGFSTQNVGREIRDALEGAIATRFQRDGEEITVRVKYPQNSSPVKSLTNFRLQKSGEMEVPLTDVVTIREQQGFSSITRENGRREVAITAETDKAITNNNKILAALRRDGLNELIDRYDLSINFAGRAEEQRTTLGDMQLGALIALSSIYIILAWIFASYTRPFAVMVIIPFGLVGAVVGHALLGYDLTILSLIALVGLSGIVVNDSIILIRTIDNRINSGQEFFEAIVDGTRDRLRAVILTSITTIGGLTPLLFETSLQAQFLIPMAVTIVFGLMVTTLLILFVAPSIVAILNDFKR